MALIKVKQLVATGSRVLGVPADDNYLDGYFPFVPSTLNSNAMDQINKNLKDLNSHWSGSASGSTIYRSGNVQITGSSSTPLHISGSEIRLTKRGGLGSAADAKLVIDSSGSSQINLNRVGQVGGVLSIATRNYVKKEAGILGHTIDVLLLGIHNTIIESVLGNIYLTPGTNLDLIITGSSGNDFISNIPSTFTKNLTLTGSNIQFVTNANSKFNSNVSVANQLSVTGSTYLNAVSGTLSFGASPTFTKDVNVQYANFNFNASGSNASRIIFKNEDGLSLSTYGYNSAGTLGNEPINSGSQIRYGTNLGVDAEGFAIVDGVNGQGIVFQSGSIRFMGNRPAFQRYGRLQFSGSSGFNSDVSVKTSLSVGTILNVTGNSTLSSNLKVGNKLTVTGSSILVGAVTANDDFSVVGTSSLSQVYVANQLSVTGSSTFNNSVLVSGSLTVIGTTNIGSSSIVVVPTTTKDIVYQNATESLTLITQPTASDVFLDWNGTDYRWVSTLDGGSF